MPLSDREQQILEDIEARLRADDPRFARAVASTTLRTQARRQVKLALVGLVIGFLLLFGIALHLLIGIAGFALMLGSVFAGYQGMRRLSLDARGSTGPQRQGFSRFPRGDED